MTEDPKRMDAKAKANKVLEYVETAPKTPTSEEVATLNQANAEKRAEFTNVLIDNIKNGYVSYEDAVKRAKNYSKNPDDASVILARISEYEFPMQRSASEKSKSEVENMDPIAENLNVLAKRFPNWSRCLGEVLKDEGWIKDSWNMGTGEQAPPDNTIEQVKKEEDNRMKSQTKEGESQMKDNEKKKEEHLRADDKSPKKEAADKKAWNLGTGDAVDSKKWDKNVDKEEEKRKGAEIKEGEKVMKENEKKREEYLRAGSEQWKVTLAKDEKNVRKSAWEIRDTKDGDLVVRATIDDITDGNEKFTDEAIAEATSEDFGNLITENLGEHGLEAVAKTLLGDDLTKYAMAEEGSIDQSNKDTSMFNVKNYGATQGKGGKDIDFGKTEVKEGGEAGKHVDAENKVSMEKIASQYFAYRGIFADLKDTVSEFAKKAESKSVSELVKKAEDMLDGVKTMIDEGAPEGDIIEPLADAGSSLNQLNDISSLIAEAKGMTDDPALAELLDKIEAAAAPAADVAIEGEVEIESSDAPAEEEASEEEKEEKEEEEVDETVEAANSLKNKLKKMAAGKDSKDYDIPQTHNIQKDFHGGEKGIQQDGAKFHNIWEVAKEIDAIGGKKAAGKLSSMLAKIKKIAEEKGVDPKKYFDSIFGDPKATKEYLAPNSVDGVMSEWNAATKDSTSQSYANLITKVKKAYWAAQDMVKRGMLKESKEEIDSQVDRFINMDEKNMENYLESLEKLSASIDFEDGRIKVAVIDPAEDKFVVRGFVDGVPVARFTKEDLNISGKVTRTALRRSAALTKTALENGMFDEVLADDDALESVGETLDGMNVGVEETKLTNINDF